VEQTLDNTSIALEQLAPVIPEAAPRFDDTPNADTGVTNITPEASEANTVAETVDAALIIPEGHPPDGTLAMALKVCPAVMRMTVEQREVAFEIYASPALLEMAAKGKAIRERLEAARKAAAETNEPSPSTKKPEAAEPAQTQQVTAEAHITSHTPVPVAEAIDAVIAVAVAAPEAPKPHDAMEPIAEVRAEPIEAVTTENEQRTPLAMNSENTEPSLPAQTSEDTDTPATALPIIKTTRAAQPITPIAVPVSATRKAEPRRQQPTPPKTTVPRMSAPRPQIRPQTIPPEQAPLPFAPPAIEIIPLPFDTAASDSSETRIADAPPRTEPASESTADTAAETPAVPVLQLSAIRERAPTQPAADTLEMLAVLYEAPAQEAFGVAQMLTGDAELSAHEPAPHVRIQELAQSIAAAFTEQAADPTFKHHEITPAIAEELQVILQLAGHEQPEEALKQLLATHDVLYVVQLIARIADPQQAREAYDPERIIQWQLTSLSQPTAVSGWLGRVLFMLIRRRRVIHFMVMQTREGVSV